MRSALVTPIGIGKRVKSGGKGEGQGLKPSHTRRPESCISGPEKSIEIFG